MSGLMFWRSSVQAFPKHCDYACALEGPRPHAMFGWLRRLFRRNP